MTFESIFKALKPDNFPFHLLQIAGFDRLSTVFCFVYVLLLKWKVFLATVFEFVYVKFMFSKKATKIDKIFTVDLTLSM